MPGRFYYAPVDPGIDELARGLARGIEGATLQYNVAAQRRREQPMRDLADAVAYAEAAQRGVHAGSAPIARVPNAPVPEAEDLFHKPEWPTSLPAAQGSAPEPSGIFADAREQLRLGGPSTTKDMLFRVDPSEVLAPSNRAALPMPATVPGQDDGRSAALTTRLLAPQTWMRSDLAPAGTREPVSFHDEAVPGYQQLTKGFYAETPEHMASRQASTKLAAEQAARDAETQRVTAILDEIEKTGRITPAAVAALPKEFTDAYLRQRGLGKPEAPVMGTPEWFAAEDKLEGIRHSHDAPRGPTPGTPAYFDMEDRLARIRAKYRTSGGGGGGGGTGPGGVTPTALYTQRARQATYAQVELANVEDDLAHGAVTPDMAEQARQRILRTYNFRDMDDIHAAILGQPSVGYGGAQGGSAGGAGAGGPSSSLFNMGVPFSQLTAPPRKPLADRVAELKRQGVPRKRAREILTGEGYTFTPGQ